MAKPSRLNCFFCRGTGRYLLDVRDWVACVECEPVSAVEAYRILVGPDPSDLPVYQTTDDFVAHLPAPAPDTWGFNPSGPFDPVRRRWEYRSFCIYYNSDETLEQLGEEGWEAYAVLLEKTRDHEVHEYYLKREK